MPTAARRNAVPVKRLGRPKDVASAETRERLLGVACASFARHGYDATTNRMIAEGAGITTGAIYHYYPSKADLYVAVYERVQQGVYHEFERAIAPHVGLVDRVRAVLDASVELNRHDPAAAGFVVGVAAEVQRHPELLQPLRDANATSANFLRRLAADAAANGELRPDVSVRGLEDLLTAVLAGLARFSTHASDSHRHAEAVAVLQRCLAGTLLA
ncbi:MAG: TetR/AcrR family transcriptional regulator [Acidimicrobiales bacterium]